MAAAGVYVAFASLSTLAASPTWVRLDGPEIGATVQSWDIDRGRNSEQDRVGTGTATVRLLDRTGALDPTFPTGPYAGQIDPMKPAKIDLVNPATGAATTVFRGFVSEWLYDMDMTEGFATVTLELADAFDLFAAIEMTTKRGSLGHGTAPTDTTFTDVYYPGTPANLPGQAAATIHVDTRINQLLDDAGWPASMRNVFSGNCNVQGVVYARRDQLLQGLQDAADAEWSGVANIFMSKDGKVAFRGRFARFHPTDPTYNIGSWRCGDQTAVDAGGGSVAPLAGMSFRRSKQDLVNACLALPQDDSGAFTAAEVAGQLVTDSGSIAQYGWRGLSFNDLLNAGGTDTLLVTRTNLQDTKNVAQYYVDNYKYPATRLTTLRFRPRPPGSFGGGALWALMTGVELGDLIHTTTRHDTGGGFDEDGFVEGIRYTAAPMTSGQHEISLELDVSPRSFYSSNPIG